MASAVSRRQRTTAPRFRSRALEEDYAEILRLIGRLHPRRTSARNTKHRADVVRPDAPSPRDPSASIAEARRGMRAPSSLADEILPLIRRLDERVERIELLLQTNGTGSGSGSPVPPDALIGGAIADDILPDMLQLVASNQLTGLFVIGASDRKYTLTFKEGELHHAEGPDVVGEQAVFAAVAIPKGHYHFEKTERLPDQRTIHSSTQLLVLEALRQIDENRGG